MSEIKPSGNLLETLKREARARSLDSQIEEVSHITSPVEALNKRSHSAGFHSLLQLTALEGRAFIEAAYQTLLKRPADPDGLNAHLKNLESGAHKVDILCDLYMSPEGRMHSVPVPGLRRCAQLRGLPLFRSRRRVRNLGYGMIKRAARGWVCLRVLTGKPFPDPVINPENEAISALQTQIDHLQSKVRIIERCAERSEAAIQSLPEQMEPLQQAIKDTRQELRSSVAALSVQRSESSSSASVCTQNNTPATDAFYLAFEDRCRGSRSVIGANLSAYFAYLPQPESCALAVDLGPGRGEWLELLKERGYTTLGIETNSFMASFCRDKGLDVIEADILQWLAEQPDDSIGLFSAFHVIEHLPFELLLRITQEVQRVLQPGGVLIYETPNPENILVGSHTFYHDPTHRNPMTPTLIDFLAEYSGFSQREILRLHPYQDEARLPGDDPVSERLNGILCGHQDFAIIARKQESAQDKDVAE